jgi:hypothetical protein
MNKYLEKMELFVDKTIPYLLVLLVVLLLIEFFNIELAESYHTQIVFADYVIITFFVIDLIFKYNRVRDIPKFIKRYWLDILAVLPYVLILRLFTEPLLIYEQFVSGFNKLFHIGVVLEQTAVAKTVEELAKIAEAERLAKISETEKITRAFESIAREESLAKTTELITKESRFTRLGRFIRPIARVPRLFKAISFYEHPRKKKTLYH